MDLFWKTLKVVTAAFKLTSPDEWLEKDIENIWKYHRKTVFRFLHLGLDHLGCPGRTLQNGWHAGPRSPARSWIPLPGWRSGKFSTHLNSIRLMRDFGFALVYPRACLVALVFAPLLVETYDQMLVWQPARAHITDFFSEPVILAFGVHTCVRISLARAQWCGKDWKQRKDLPARI